jgi:hypothetical protein
VGLSRISSEGNLKLSLHVTIKESICIVYRYRKSSSRLLDYRLQLRSSTVWQWHDGGNSIVKRRAVRGVSGGVDNIGMMYEIRK